jgi:hypothetical protein
MKKKLFSLALTCLMTLTCTIVAFAENVGNDPSEYQETHFQINFSDYNVKVVDNSLHLTSKERVTRNLDKDAANNLCEFEEVLEKYPDVKENLISDYRSSENLLAVSFTEAPLVYVDGHYERVSARSDSSSSSEESRKGNFLMYTTVSRGSQSANGNYKYTAKTYGSWYNNASGGEDFPDSGDDFILQASPNTFSRVSDNLTATYNYDPPTGTEGREFWSESGDSTYVRYGIKDDPLGYRQLRNFTLTTVSEGPKSSGYRNIGSYYVHTWESMTLDVNISASSSKSVSLTLKPEKTSSSWQLYNYVSFNF